MLAEMLCMRHHTGLHSPPCIVWLLVLYFAHFHIRLKAVAPSVKCCWTGTLLSTERCVRMDQLLLNIRSLAEKLSSPA